MRKVSVVIPQVPLSILHTNSVIPICKLVIEVVGEDGSVISGEPTEDKKDQRPTPGDTAALALMVASLSGEQSSISSPAAAAGAVAS